MADVQYVTLYLRGGTPVTVIAGSVLYGIYLAAGATLYPSQTPPGSGIPTNPADPFPQYITAAELAEALNEVPVPVTSLPQRRWDLNTGIWSDRPNVLPGTVVESHSELYPSAPPPPGSQLGDIWAMHPSSPYWPA